MTIALVNAFAYNNKITVCIYGCNTHTAEQEGKTITKKRGEYLKKKNGRNIPGYSRWS